MRRPTIPPGLLVDAATAWADEERRPLGIVDLDACPADLQPAALPPYPLVGIGDRRHPLAHWLDAVVEPPVSLDAVVRTSSAAPLAAAAAVALLRGLGGLDPRPALPLESLAYAALQGSEEHRRWLATRAPAPTMPPGRLLARRTDRVLELAIDRPAARNAIDRALRDALHRAFTAAALDPDPVPIVLRATGAAFSIGGDLAEFGTTADPATAHAIRARTLPAHAIARCRDRLHVHVQGACIGAGLEMAAFATRLTASPGAWFQLPELSMGLIPGAGGCVSLPLRIGRQRVGLLLLSGRRIGARTALDWGLVDAIVDEPPVDPDATDLDPV